MNRSIVVVAALVAVALAVVGGGCRTSDGLCPASNARDVVVDPGGVDVDDDGLADAYELALARAHLPFIAHHPEDHCPTAGIVFRARPHPDDDDHADGLGLVNVIYSQLYAVDCGLDGHIGDNEAFGVTIDPSLPPPAGLVAVVAVSHQGTPCERTTTCGTCAGMNACDVVDGRPVLYASRDKHGGVVDVGAGCSIGSCLETCALPDFAADVPLVNAGEPDHPLVDDLTAHGFIHEGWSAELQHFDPWSEEKFGDAGVISGDLTDDVFVPPACSCRQ